MVTTLYLIRHGQTEWNAEGLLQGQTDIPLNKAGISEAHLVAQEFQGLPITAIYASPLSRAFETAQILNQHHRHEIRSRDGLKEVFFGSLEGGKYPMHVGQEELSREEQLRFKPCPEAESYEEVYNRTRPILDEIIRNHPGEQVVVVTHGGVMRAVIAEVAEIAARNIRVKNIGFVKLVGNGDKVTLHEFQRVEIG